MDLLRPDDLFELLGSDGSAHVSIYQPSHRGWPDAQQDPIRFKNLIKDARKRLIDGGLRDVEADDVLKPAVHLLEDDDFWRYQGDGLAVFCAPGRSARYRLPIGFDELVHVNNRFHVKPLLPLFAGDRPFYVLAISQNQTRVLAGSRQGIRELEVPTLPQSLVDALKYDEPSERNVIRHAGTGARGRDAAFHGHGTPDDDENERIRRYFRKINEGMRALLRQERAPLVLAGVEYYEPIYREANTYPHLVDDMIIGNPDRVRPDELHAKAWEIVERQYRAERDAAADAVREAIGTGRGTTDLAEVITIGEQGRIHTVFVAQDEQRWGSVNLEDATVRFSDERGRDDEDLLDRAAVLALRFGGEVFPVPRAEMPAGEVVAASIRT